MSIDETYLAQGPTDGEEHGEPKKTDHSKPPSVWRRYGLQIGIFGVAVLIWVAFIAAAPEVFLRGDIYKAFAST
ncbi:MAG: hypothetical protein ACO4AM_08010, partial [Candidatus Nanopelagicaceae bacterium]